MPADTPILAAAARLVHAFATGDLDSYFDAFAPEATFLFHTTPQRLLSRDEYRACWANWVREADFRVLSCESSNPVVRFVGDVAVFMHDVRTRLATTEGEQTADERETILFRADATGRWLAWHEHLSPHPAGSP